MSSATVDGTISPAVDHCARALITHSMSLVLSRCLDNVLASTTVDDDARQASTASSSLSPIAARTSSSSVDAECPKIPRRPVHARLYTSPSISARSRFARICSLRSRHTSGKSSLDERDGRSASSTLTAVPSPHRFASPNASYTIRAQQAQHGPRRGEQLATVERRHRIGDTGAVGAGLLACSGTASCHGSPTRRASGTRRSSSPGSTRSGRATRPE